MGWQSVGAAKVVFREVARAIFGPVSQAARRYPWRDLRWRAGDAVIRYGAAWAGVPVSIRWRGREWLRSHAGPWRPLWFDRDRGRSLQSAVSFDGHREAYNPTQAGRRGDFRRISSTSRWLSVVAENNLVRNEVDPAFWRKPGPDAINKVDRDGYHIATRHHWTQSGDLLTLDHLVRFRLPRDHGFAKFEIIAIYSPADFSDHYTWQGALVPRVGGMGEGHHPPIMATPDGSAAVGLWSEWLPQGASGYGNFWFSDTQKINGVWRQDSVAAGHYEFTCRAYFGTLDAVAAAIGRRH